MLVLVNESSKNWFAVDNITGESTLVKLSCREVVGKFNKSGILTFPDLKHINKIRKEFKAMKYKDIPEDEIVQHIKMEYAEYFI